MHVEGWIFDIEILVLCERLNVSVSEVPIRWQEVDGSKMNLMRDSVKMALDLLVIRLNYAVGRWGQNRLGCVAAPKKDQ